MAFSGSIIDFSIADIFNLFSQQMKTGTLALQRNDQRALLELSSGKIIKVRLGDETPESRIKNVLINMNRLDEREYADLFSLSRRTAKSVRQMLVSKNHLTVEENESWYKIAMEDLILSLFFWKEGNYHFESKKRPVLTGNAQDALPMDYLTLEGVRHVDEWQRLIKKFPDAHAIFKVKTTDYAEYELDDGKYLMDRVDGRKSINALQRELPFGAFRFFSYLAKLWEEGFLEIEEDIDKIDVAEIITKKTRPFNIKVAAVIFFSLLVISASVAVRLSGVMELGSQTALSRIREQQAVTQLKLMTIDYVLEKGELPASISSLSEASNNDFSLRAYLPDNIQQQFPENTLR